MTKKGGEWLQTSIPQILSLAHNDKIGLILMKICNLQKARKFLEMNEDCTPGTF